MKTCTYCGKEYPDEAIACAVDGQPLRSSVATAQTLPPTAEKHSKFGIASFIASLTVGGLLFATIIVGSLLNSDGHLQRGEQYPGQVIVGLVIIFLLGVDVIAAGLGIVALCQPRTRRVFGILGLVFSLLTILGTIALIVIGLLVAGRYRG